MQTSPVLKDLVLLGGGHSHVSVLRRFGMQPIPGVRLTLICRELHTPYSGMLPGLIAGHYEYDDAHIDLAPLAAFAGARLVHASAEALDPQHQWVYCGERPPISYDALSIDIGITPHMAVPGACAHALPVKPVSNFYARWQALQRRVMAASGVIRIGVIGAGAGGFELLLALRFRLLEDLAAREDRDLELKFYLITVSEAPLATHNRRVRARCRQVLEELGVSCYYGAAVDQVCANGVRLETGESVALDEMLWVTHASAPQWLAAAGIATDDDGFIKVHASLQSQSHENIFAAGDIASVVEHPRPKAGVFAVRQGRPLSLNLRRYLLRESLVPYRPQRQFLSLISTGTQHAIASKGPWCVSGAWVWRWKDWIDRRFIAKFSTLPAMGDTATPPVPPPLLEDPEAAELLHEPMRCGGCGAKLGADLLRAALQELEVYRRDEVEVGLSAADDAAVVRNRANEFDVHSVDGFRAFVDDPYIFGQIAAAHALNDIFAMQAEPRTALALITLPLGTPKKMRDDLVQVMAGAVAILNQEQTTLIGGHTAEGLELSASFAVNGALAPGDLLAPNNARAGDRVILSKALGSGVLFAAAMQQKAKGRWLASAIRSMLNSNRRAAACFAKYGAHALTDVTGFGLLGHLKSLLSMNVSAHIHIASLPLLNGVASLLDAGIRSSLHGHNRRAVTVEASDTGVTAICFDPQTAGGLLATVPASTAAACVAELHALGYVDAADIGYIGAATTEVSIYLETDR